MLAACGGGTNPPDAGVEPSRVDAARSTVEAGPSGPVLANGSDPVVLTVVTRNAEGGAVAGRRVDLEISGTGHQVVSSAETTDASGTWTAEIRSTRAEVKTVRAFVNRGEPDEVKLAELKLTFLSVPATELVFEQQPTTVAARTAFSPPVKVKLVDGAGNAIPASSRISIRLKETVTAATLSGTTAVDAVNGVATFDTLKLDRIGTGYVLEATGAGFVVGSRPFDVVPGPATRFELSAPPDAVRAGNTWDLVVTARDAVGNIAAGYFGTVEFTSTDSAATLPERHTFTAAEQGVARFEDALVFVTAGTQELIATDSADASIQGRRSTTVMPTWASRLLIRSDVPDGTVRTSLTPAVVVTFADSYGNEGALADRALTVRMSLAGATPGAADLGGTLQQNAPTGASSVAFADLSLAGEGTFSLLAQEVNVPPGKAAFASGTSTPFTVVDDQAPSAPAQFTASTRNHESIRLQWIAPGDDGVLGTALAYDLRYATSAISTETEFAQATVFATNSPATPGIAEEASITGLPAGTDFYFAIRATDGAGNSSPFATATARTLAHACAGANPCNTPPAAGCVGNIARSYAPTSTCTPTSQAPGYSCAAYPGSNVDCAAQGAVCVGGACVVARAPVPGDLVITEVMHSPSAGTTEYLELFNRTPDRLDLSGVTLVVTGNPQQVTFPSTPVLLDGHSYFVLGQSPDAATNGGVPVDFAWGQSPTLQGDSSVELRLGTTALTTLAWTSAFPQTAGRSMNLSSQTYQGDANNRPWYWCDSTQVLAGGDHGTPGAANGDCGVAASAPFDWCSIQWPKTSDWAGLNRTAPLNQEVFSRFWEPTITDRNTSGVDGYPNVQGQLGHGSSADPSTWTWLSAGFNTGYGGGNNDDELMATLAITSPGTYFYGYRYRLVDPVLLTPSPWTLCDENGVVTSGSPAWSQVVVVGASGP
ncbi:MAG: Ig-like domain-containing protein [Myxococcaceae bacterium]